MSIRLVIAGGGTGGHVFPAIAIAHAVKKLEPAAEILFVGARGKMEMEKVPQAGYRIEGLDIAGFNRSSLIKNIWLPFRLLKSFFQVRRILGDFKPDAALGVGGYSSFPVLRYAQQKGIRTYIHEANSFAGKSNILLGRNATRIFVATDGMDKFFPAERIRVTGNPVRESIVSGSLSREEGLAFFGLDPAKRTILSIGGSLGARSINEALESGLGSFAERDVQLIWQTGKPFAERGQRAAHGSPGVWVGDFIRQMEMAYAAADLVISRAGAMAIAELCVVGKPAVLVPYPHAAEDHQTVNARHLAQKGAGILIPDGDAAGRLVREALNLLGDPERLDAMRAEISRLGVRDADMIIAKEIVGR